MVPETLLLPTGTDCRGDVDETSAEPEGFCPQSLVSRLNTRQVSVSFGGKSCTETEAVQRSGEPRPSQVAHVVIVRAVIYPTQ